ncbi:ABC transporter permease [Conexibacter arvalis]|uniref:Peptide/nickel transport system permease protein n=1 Tax=Conexibacter arvalis TaxID=912552 RepID=A0A840I894_9ACTN|nr:ABC transporter permease [Conexibacter arvalis]MBB4660545.1 peptide/nickel transport system permease protein [Conexibacter arvalis]
MTTFLVKRGLQAIPLLIGISLLLFAMLQMTPGGPLASSEGTGAQNAARVEQIREHYGLDDPLPVQYFNWAGGVATGDWGTSFNTGRPVLTMIWERLPNTLLLTGAAFLLAIAIAVPIGVLAARKQYSWFDYVSSGLSFVGVAMPSFWLALMLLFVFSYSLGWLPSGGLEDLRADHEGFSAVIDRVRHMILPVIVLAAVSTAQLARYVRGAMLDVLQQDYVRTARGSGLRERTVIVGHALRNAAIPVVTVAVLTIPELFLGSVVMETIFAIPGIGRLFVESANLRDYPVLLGILMIGAALVVVANLVADIVYSLLDPRIRYAS